MLDFPVLAAEHVDGARLFATRQDLVDSLSLPARPVIAEIGVALGEFSRFMIDRFGPSEFHAFDLFQLHLDATLWGMPTSQVLEGRTHADFYRSKFPEALVYEGSSGDTLHAVADGKFDLIYVDGAHDYEAVAADARQCERIVKSDGVLVFNDYIMHDPFLHADYGIVPVVNEMVVNGGWKVIGFGLQKHLFCDIAIRRTANS